MYHGAGGVQEGMHATCRKQRKFCMQQTAPYAASCMQQAADSAACCICTKYLFRGLHSARGIHLYRLVWPLSGHRTPPALQPRTTRTRHGPHPFANRTRSPAPPRQGPPPVLLHRLAAPYLHGMRAMACLACTRQPRTPDTGIGQFHHRYQHRLANRTVNETDMRNRYLKFVDFFFLPH